MRTNVWSYINSVPKEWDDDTKEWYKTFVWAYYYQSTKAMDKIKMPRDMRRAIYRNHRAIKNDPFNKSMVDYWENVENVE